MLEALRQPFQFPDATLPPPRYTGGEEGCFRCPRYGNVRTRLPGEYPRYALPQG